MVEKKLIPAKGWCGDAPSGGKYYELQGFVDLGTEEVDAGVILVYPVTLFLDEGGTNIESGLEDIGIDLSLGDEPKDEATGMSRPYVRSLLTRAYHAWQRGKEFPRFQYFYIKLEVMQGDDVELPFYVAHAEGNTSVLADIDRAFEWRAVADARERAT